MFRHRGAILTEFKTYLKMIPRSQNMEEFNPYPANVENMVSS